MIKFKLYIHLVLFFLPILAYSQLLDSLELSKTKKYLSIESALKEPDKVIRLDLKRKHLKSIPKEVFQLKNLQELMLRKNKIKDIPPEISFLKSLQILDVSSNKLTTLPKEIGDLENLKKLTISDNEIYELPKEIGKLKKLEILDMWANEIDLLPDEISNIKDNLKILDMRVIDIKQDFQEKIEKQLPKTKIYFSEGCNCN